MLRRLSVLLLCACLLSSQVLWAHAEEAAATDITASTSFSGGGLEDHSLFTDGMETEYLTVSEELTLTCESGIGGVYLVFDQPCAFTVIDPESGNSLSRDSRYLHEFISLAELSSGAAGTVTLRFPQGAFLSEVRVYSPGAVPDTVQQWSAPLEGRADIVLLSTHGDDEQLYFAGLLPEYAGQRQLNVQVVYMTGHDNICGSERKHEMLNGLWAVGVRAYPVFGPFPDFKLMDREESYREYERLGFSRADLLRFVVGNLRRFRPQAVIGHDLNGEYGHGMHMIYADLLTQAVDITADAEAFPEQVDLYGTWDVPKTYLHLYEGNPITLDYDRPLDRFDGMTAFEVTQKFGFPCHISQQYDLYTHWLYGEDTPITRATEIQTWSPCSFGLYRSTVGEDVQKNDFMENLTSYAQQEAEAAAIAAMQEQPLPETLATDPTAPATQAPQEQSLPGTSDRSIWMGIALLAAAAALFLYKKK